MNTCHILLESYLVSPHKLICMHMHLQIKHCLGRVDRASLNIIRIGCIP